MSNLYKNYLKILLDFLLALSMLVILSPIMIIIAIAIKWESPGPSIFKQIRVGKNQKEFYIYKFRSMYLNNDKSFTSANDPRITTIGKFIRKTSLDELPQLINILKGEMSFVGPRPCQPFESNQYSLEVFKIRHSVRPGITGLHQTRFRSSGTLEDRSRCDTEYTNNISFLLDVKLIIDTFKVVLNTKKSN